MYQDFMRIFRQRGLDELYLKSQGEMSNTNLDIQGMIKEMKPILGIPVKSLSANLQMVEDVGYMEKADLLQKGKFYLAQRKGQGWGVFYVNPVNWFNKQKDEIGLVYLGWDGLGTLIVEPDYFVNKIDSKGWNKSLADVGSIKEYQDDPRLARLLAVRAQLDESSTFFQDEGWVFYEIPNPNTRLGLFNWWW